MSGLSGDERFGVRHGLASYHHVWDNANVMMQNADGDGYDPNVPAKIGPWLRDALKREAASRGFSQAELAHRADVNRSHLNELLMGHRLPHLETLERLTKAMRLRLSQFIAEAERLREASPVAVAYIVRDARLLMVQRRDPDYIPEWGAPAGTTRPGEKPEDAAVREVREQVELEIEVYNHLGTRLHPASNRTLVYFASGIVSGEVTLSPELVAHEWCDWAAVQDRWTGIRGGVFGPVRDYLMTALEAKA